MCECAFVGAWGGVWNSRTSGLTQKVPFRDERQDVFRAERKRLVEERKKRQRNEQCLIH